MLTDKDIGEPVTHPDGRHGFLRLSRTGLWIEAVGRHAPAAWNDLDGWTLDEQPGSVHARCTAEVVGIRCDLPSGHEGAHVMPPIGKAAVKEWLGNLPPVWREVREHVKARDPKGRRRRHEPR